MPDPAPDAFAAARTRVFETVKWLASTLGAVGGALATGVALTGLPKLEGAALQTAVAVGAVGLACLLIGIAVLVSLLLHPPFTLDDLMADAKLKRKAEALVPYGHGDLDAFLKERSDLIAATTAAQIIDRAASADPGKSSEDKDAARHAANEVAGRLASLEPHVGHIVSYGSLLRLRRRVGWAFAGLALLAVAGFASLAVVAFQIGAAGTGATPPARSLTIEWSREGRPAGERPAVTVTWP